MTESGHSYSCDRARIGCRHRVKTGSDAYLVMVTARCAAAPRPHARYDPIYAAGSRQQPHSAKPETLPSRYLRARGDGSGGSPWLRANFTL
jgi:hypothetical protein